MSPPPGGPRDWSVPDIHDRPLPRTSAAGRPHRGAGHIEGLNWARFLAWVALVIGVASIVLAFVVPLAVDPSRVLWIAGFASFAIWVGFMAEARYRSVRRRGSSVSKLGAGLGIATIAIAIYAYTAIVLASSGTVLPAPAHWVVASEPAGTSDTVSPNSTEVATAPLPPAESERLALGQSVGTAVYVLEQNAASDGTWPASLAVTTDASTLMTPAGITLSPLPPGTQVLYSTSSDLQDFSLTLVGPLGAVATYESTIGTIASSVPASG